MNSTFGYLNRIKQFLKPPSPSLNFSKKRIKKLVEKLPSDARILDLGSGHRKLTQHAVNLDLFPLLHVNIIGDGHFLPFKDNIFDAIICQAVLEHVTDPKEVIKEIERTEKHNGIIYVEIPFLQGFHADPMDFQRFTIKGIERLFSSFQKDDLGVCVGPMSAFCWWIRKLPTIFIKNKNLSKLVEFISGWLTFWLKYLDLIFAKAHNAHIISAGFYFCGIKSKK